MNGSDLLDLILDLLPRRGRQLVVVALAALAVVNVGTAVRVAEWYGREKAAPIVHQIQSIPVPATSAPLPRQ